MITKQLLVAALAVAIVTPLSAGPVRAESANPVDVGIAAAAAALAQEGTVAEYASVRTGDNATAMLDMGLDEYAASPMTDGKRFSVFCLSMAASLAVMLGVFGLMVRRKRNT
ncbi:hypothetical protein [Saccharibacillus sacchari]|uniref:Uncharacterized protein n=1 Tax=Saccharibacillus sacchari TaxID=456493 RepID=A0ACC6PDA3_9BACL